MQKEDLVRNMNFKLKLLNLGDGPVGNFNYNYKAIKKQVKPEWPQILRLATMSDLNLNLKKTGLRAKDMETIAYMLAENPFGESKIQSLML